MFKMTALLKKIALVTLVLAIGLAAFPLTSASAAGSNDQTNPHPGNPRLEKAWVHLQRAYQRQGNRLARSGNFIANVQGLIDKANTNGWNTSSLQDALDAFSAAIPAAQAAHDPGVAIIASHAGFDADGKVTDRATAITTVKSLSQVIKDTHTAMNGTGKALREAIKTFRDAHPRPTTTPAP
jgi:hypothetical protein